jgi:hypothetical protein
MNLVINAAEATTSEGVVSVAVRRRVRIEPLKSTLISDRAG